MTSSKTKKAVLDVRPHLGNYALTIKRNGFCEILATTPTLAKALRLGDAVSRRANGEGLDVTVVLKELGS